MKAPRGKAAGPETERQESERCNLLPENLAMRARLPLPKTHRLLSLHRQQPQQHTMSPTHEQPTS